MRIAKVIAAAIPACLAAAGAAALFWWAAADTGMKFSLRLPLTGQPATEEERAGTGPAFGTLRTFDGEPADAAGSWPRFRGPNFDNVSPGTEPLARFWPESGPKVLWSIEVGEGHAGAAVLNGRVYMLDYDRRQKADAARCLSLADGRDIWRYSYPVKVKRNHGMSRTVPAVTDEFMVTIGPKCHVACLDSKTGELLWGMDLVKRYGTAVPPWYAGQCPLIDGKKAIIAPAGSALMIAVDCESGNILWESPNPDGWKMTHSSVMPAEFDGRRVYVYCASGGVAGVAAKDGRILWKTDRWTILVANVPSPVPVGRNGIFLAGGYNAGSAMLRLVSSGPDIEAKIEYRLEPELFSSNQHTPVYYEGSIFGIRQDGQMACITPQGRLLWESGPTRRFGLGPFVIASGLIYAMDSEGVLTVAEASNAGFFPLAQAKVLDGPDSWGPIAIVSGRLICRDLDTMVCLDIDSSQ